ncbi:MAG: CocE/NonD family hydrolase [bacterium]|nr:CocE/NonD family hydrolase [bacterium]
MITKLRIKSLIVMTIILILSLMLITSCAKDSVVNPDIQQDTDEMTTESLYLTMRDGVRIAVDLHLPEPLQEGVEIPAIIMMTKYWRSLESGENEYMEWRLEDAVSRGYAFISVDERGSGASFGTWRYPWAPESTADYAEIVDWIVDQDWSNGRVGAWGISYLGMTAQLLPVIQHSAVRAIVPTFTQYDLYTDIVYPGGVFNETYIKKWRDENYNLDQNNNGGSSVKPVDADNYRSLLMQAIAEHGSNGDVYEGFRNVVYRDAISSSLGITIDEISSHTFKDDLEQSGVAIYHWGSWMDRGGTDNVISRFLTLSNPQCAKIGAWEHGGFRDASPYTSPGLPQPSESEQWADILDFLDIYLKEEGTGSTEKVLYYYTLGAEEWRSTDVWPVAGTTNETWYFTAENTLSDSMPADIDSRDSYTIDFTTTSGLNTRWDGHDLYTEDRMYEDEKLLVYTSETLSEDMEITGHPIVTLYVTSTHTDGAFYVYLEDIDPGGRVTYITEGILRALHRKVSGDPAPYVQLTPYHSFKEADGEQLVPGEITEVTFGLMPTSVLIRAGHRIRVAIAGHDANWFPRIPSTGDPVVTVERNMVYASKIELPVVR